MQGAPIDMQAIREQFDGELRLFPLPNLVLFPDGFVPLKVFEKRYIQLVEDALADDGLIGMALLKPGWEEDYKGNPDIHTTVCVGKMLKQNQTPTGKYDVLLYGLFRARIEEEIGSYPYRTARVRILEDQARPTETEAIAKQMRRALELVPGRKAVIWEMRRMSNQLRGIDSAPGRYADAVANASDLQQEDRYRILAEQDVGRRLDALIKMLEQRAYAGAPQTPRGTRPELN